MNLLVPLGLLAYASVVTGYGATWLGAWRLMHRSTPFAILTWQALSISALVSAGLAGAAIALPSLPVTTDLALLLTACADALREHYATPGGAVTSAIGALFAVALVGRTGWCIAHELLHVRAARTRQAHALRLVCQGQRANGAFLIEAPEPAIFCVPGRERRVIFTTSAWNVLSAPERAAVMAHEQAHLRWRHHLVVAVARGTARAWPGFRLFQAAADELGRLVEVHADDVASQRHGRRVLGSALLHLTDAYRPAGTMGAAGGSLAGRVTRLAAPPVPLRTRSTVLLAGVPVALMLTPLIAASLPALSALAMHYCPLDWGS